MLLWHLQNIICIMAFITNVIIAIIAIIVIIFFWIYRLTKVVFGLDTGFNWRKSFFYTRASCRSKNIVKSRWWVHLRFGWHPSKTCVKHRLWPSAGQRRGRYGAAYSAQSLYPPCTAGRTERNRYSPCRSDDSMAQTWRCIEVTWNLSPCVFTWFNPLRFITCPGTIPKPTSWRTTSCIHRQHPVVGRRERQEMCCAGGTG